MTGSFRTPLPGRALANEPLARQTSGGRSSQPNALQAPSTNLRTDNPRRSPQILTWGPPGNKIVRMPNLAADRTMRA